MYKNGQRNFNIWWYLNWKKKEKKNYCHKSPILLKVEDIDIVLVSSRISSGKKN